MNKSICFDLEVVEKMQIYQSDLNITINQNIKSQLKKCYSFEKVDLWQTYFKGQQFKKLKVLYIQKSSLQQLPQNDAPLLEVIFLCQTKIQNIQSLLNRFYPNLTRIKLLANNIHTLPLIKAPSLSQLDIENNGIYSITQFAQGYYPKLNTLNLGYNNFSNKLPWINSPQLQQLFLENNGLSQTTIQLFQKGCYSKLKQLSMLNNSYEKIPIFIKQGAYQKIQTLNLKQNKVKNIELLAIIDLNSLKYLSLSGNLISNLKAFHKTQYKNLSFIRLEHNCFSQISYLEQCCFQKRSLELNLFTKYSELTTDLSKVFKLKNGEITAFGDWKNEEIWRKIYSKRRESSASALGVGLFN